MGARRKWLVIFLGIGRPIEHVWESVIEHVQNIRIGTYSGTWKRSTYLNVSLFAGTMHNRMFRSLHYACEDASHSQLHVLAKQVSMALRNIWHRQLWLHWRCVCIRAHIIMYVSAQKGVLRTLLLADRNVRLYHGWYRSVPAGRYPKDVSMGMTEVVVSPSAWIENVPYRRRVFHLPSCGYVKQMGGRYKRVLRSEAEQKGFRPCSMCR
jgi:hypothetical protein